MFISEAPGSKKSRAPAPELGSSGAGASGGSGRRDRHKKPPAFVPEFRRHPWRRRAGADDATKRGVVRPGPERRRRPCRRRLAL